jgi:hypothetical protein
VHTGGPFVVHESDALLTVPVDPDLATEHRAVDRHEFDEHVSEKMRDQEVRTWRWRLSCMYSACYGLRAGPNAAVCVLPLCLGPLDRIPRQQLCRSCSPLQSTAVAAALDVQV